MLSIGIILAGFSLLLSWIRFMGLEMRCDVETGCNALLAGSTASYFVKTEAIACLFLVADFWISAIPSSNERPCFDAASGA